MDWAVATTAPNSEHLAAEHLRRRGVVSYTPRYCNQRILRGRYVETPRPLFPGYLFVEAEHVSTDVRGITGTIGRLSRSIVDFWRAQECDTGFVKLPNPFEVGVAVRVRRRHHELVGKCDGMDDKQRVWVLLSLLGRTVRHRFERADLILA